MSDSKKKFSFFKEKEDLDSELDGAKLVGSWREKGTDYSHPYHHNWGDIDRKVYGDEKQDLFTFIYGDDYYNNDDSEVNITYTKNDTSAFFSAQRSEYPDYFIDHRLECKMTPNMGRGIYAKEEIPEGVLIESAPVILCHQSILQEVIAIHGKMTLGEYPFGWGHNGLMAISMGWGGIYNHNPRPNAVWRPNYDLESIEYRTCKKIEKGEQVFIRYLPVWQLENLWFEDEESEAIVEERETSFDWRENPSTPASWKMFRPGAKKKKK